MNLEVKLIIVLSSKKKMSNANAMQHLPCYAPLCYANPNTFVFLQTNAAGNDMQVRGHLPRINTTKMQHAARLENLVHHLLPPAS
jgi:hypothetical protein